MLTQFLKEAKLTSNCDGRKL